jgi:uncharacterized membrane protein YdjX (TVP38/TMEM64 family)
MSMERADRKKIIIASVAVLMIILFWAYRLNDYFSLAYFKSMHSGLVDAYHDYPLRFISAYMAVYIAITVLGLPVSIPLSLLGGSIFGFWAGIIMISFASTIGATLACLVSRYLFRDWVQRAFSGKLAAINRGIEEEGPFYLFSLRLIPLIPFEAINFAMGVTPMPIRTFYLVSQAGMLPATIVFVNAGRELSRIESAAGILSPALVISFTLIAIFPFAAKKALALYRRRKGNIIPNGGKDGRL